MNAKGVAKDEDEKDSDYDFAEFEDAEVEEAEDRIYSEYKRCQAKGQAVDEQVMEELAGNVPLENMDQSIVMSAYKGAFAGGSNVKLGKIDSSLLDVSNMMTMDKQ